MDTTRGTPSANPAKDARDARDEMKSILEEIRALNEEVTQALQTTPSLSSPQPTPRPQWHPSDPLVTERQKQLAWFYDFFGVVGLAYWIKEIAEAQLELNSQSNVKAHPSWQRLIDDYNLGPDSRVLYYLCTLHPDLIPVLIRGDLPARMEEDPAFKLRFTSMIDLKNTQGAYAIYPARAASQTQDNTQINNPKAGLNLTLRELLELCQVIKQYIDLDRPNDDLARKIDTAMRSPNCDKWAIDGKRRYAGGTNHDQMTHAEEWLDAIESAYLRYARSKLNTPEEYLLDIPLRRCFPYVGLARQTLQRGPQHWVHFGSESILYGLITATMEYLWPGQLVLKPYSYHLISIVRKEDIGLDEIFVTILTSAYGWETGLCHWFAGSQAGGKAKNTDASGKDKANRSKSIDRAAADFDKELKRNAKAIRESGFIDHNIKDARDKRENTRKLLDFIQKDELPKRLQALQALKENNKKLADKLLERAESTSLQLDIKLLKEAIARYDAA